MRDPLHSNNLVPFKRRRNGYLLPGGTEDSEAQAMERVDPDLSVEEQGYVRHYLAYADTFLQNAKEELWSPDGDIAGWPSAKQDTPKKSAA
jgi:hypothetical protein